MKKPFWILILGGCFLFVANAKSMESPDPSNNYSAQRSSDIRDTRVRDGKRQLAHLCKKLNLTADQKLGVRAILLDRDRQIDLIYASESLPDKSKDTRIRTIVVNSNLLVENVLNNNQKQKFEEVLARQRKRKDGNRHA